MPDQERLDPTTQAERKEWLEEAPAAASVYRLIADVERLEAEVAEFRLHLEDMGRQVHVRNADVKVLEAERDRLLLDAALDERVR